EAAIDAKGAAALDPPLRKITALSSVRGLAPLVAELHAMGVNALFSFGAEADFKEASMVRAIADQGGLGLPDRDYYFRDDARSAELRKQYFEHVGRMTGLLEHAPQAGDAAAATPAARATVARVEAVRLVETALARNALDVVHRRDPAAIYHKM